MGCDMTVRVAKLNKETNLYEELVLYTKGEEYRYNEKGEKIIINPNFKRISIYDERNTEMFDGMKDGDEEDGYGYFPHNVLNLASLEPELAKDIKEIWTNDSGYFDFWELTLADMKAYLREHPTVTNYNVDWGEGIKAFKINPIEELYNTICSYCSFADGWNWGTDILSSYKVIIYFDW